LSIATTVAFAATFAGAACIALAMMFWSALLPAAWAVADALVSIRASAHIDLVIAGLLWV
jgi:hypothetical protein